MLRLILCQKMGIIWNKQGNISQDIQHDEKKAKETSMLRCHFSTAHLLSMDFEKREALGAFFTKLAADEQFLYDTL